MAFILVNIGTDGYKDWVKTSDGQKLSLGTCSALSFVIQLSRNSRLARKALSSFNRGEETMLQVDEAKMWDLLTPSRSRWASFNGSFMTQDQRHTATPPMRTPMNNLPELLQATKSIVAYCNKQASSEKPIDPKAFSDLGRIARTLEANQSDNSYFYFKGIPALDRPQEGFANEESSPAGLVEQAKSAASGLTFDDYHANLKVAEDILAKAKETVATIEAKIAAGKEFNDKAAKADVFKVTNKVASICEKTALTEVWVKGDLAKLSAEASRIHSLFHPKA